MKLQAIASLRRATACSAAAFLTFALQLTTEAQVRIVAEEVGADVVFTISGTFSPALAGIDTTRPHGPADGIHAAQGSFWFSPNKTENFTVNSFTVTGPTSFGSGGVFYNPASLSLSGSADFLLSAATSDLSFDQAYSGGAINGNMTYTGESFASLGIDSAGGPYVWDAGGEQTLTLEFPGVPPRPLIRPVAELVPSDAPEDGQFGTAVAIYGDTAAVGQPSLDGPGRGAVRVFQRNGSGTADGWDQSQVILDPFLSLSEQAEFGASLALSHSTLVVGAPSKDVTTASQVERVDAGTVYVFRRQLSDTEPPSLRWERVASLTAPAPQNFAAFGLAVSVSADRIAVGEPYADADLGRVHLFERNDVGADAWGHVETIHGPLESRSFGRSVSLCGDRLLVGSPRTDSERGRAYVYERNREGVDKWGLVATLVEEPEGGQEEYDYFGWSVSLHGETAIVGIPGDNDYGEGSGAAQIHERNALGVNSWGKVAKLLAPDSDERGAMGGSVSLWNDYAVVGAPRAAHEASPGAWAEWGAAHVYQRNRGGLEQWGWAQTMRPLAGGSNWGYGRAVCTWNGQFVIGASTAEENRGKAYIRAFRYSNRFTKVAEIPNTHPGGFFFGRSLRLYNDTLVIASGSETTGSKVSIHERNQGGEEAWGEVAELSVPDPLDGLDATIAFYGDFVAVGNRNSEAGGFSTSGTIHLFDRNADGLDKWGHFHSIDQPGHLGRHLGETFDIHHRFLFAPTKATDIAFADLFCFERNEGGADQWDFIGASPAADPEQRQTRPVAIHGDIAVAGIPSFTGSEAEMGLVTVYTRNDGLGRADSWDRIRDIFPSDSVGIGSARFGSAISLSGDTAKGMTLAVGAPKAVNAEGSGGVYLFQQYQPDPSGAPLTWGEIKKIPPPEPPYGAGTVEGFGTHMRLSDSLLAATGRWSSLRPDDTWWVFIFERNEGGADEWGLIDQLEIGPVNGGGGDLPVGMDLYGDTLVIGLCGWEGKGKVEVWRRGIQSIEVLDIVPQGKPTPEYGNGGVSLRWFALGGIAYAVEYSDTLEPGDWKVLPGYGHVLGQDALTSALDQKVEGKKRRFYRLVLRIAPVPATQSQ